ncbi:hypothetical protein [Rhodoflexus sp.]
MEDKLKTLVQQHLKETETLQAPDFLWERIAADLDRLENAETPAQQPRRRLWLKPLMRIAAAVVVLLMAGIFALQRWQPADQAAATAWADYPELQQAEEYFRPMIVAKVQRLEQLGDKSLTAALLQDLALLEQDYETLSKDLRDNADNAQIVKAMVENYRSRLQLLERILNEIEQKQNDEKADMQL